MKTDYETIKAKLEAYPEFRERSFRGKYLTKLALRETGLENRYKENFFISEDELSDFAIKYDSLRHAWGEVTRDCENLRGLDYSKGKILAQKKQIELGYIPGFADSIKALNRL